jgi:hypothetical protein
MYVMSSATRADEARRLLITVGPQGMTWREYATASGGHHGSASGMLSKLHAEGDAARLTEKRDKCAVYVAPEFVGDRSTVAPLDKAGTPRALKVAHAIVEAEMALERLQWEAVRAELEISHQVELVERDNSYRALMTQIMELENSHLVAADAHRAAMKDMSARLITLEMAVAVAEADQAERQSELDGKDWQAGYDEGIAAGQQSNEAYAEGRSLGRLEGEERLRKHIALVGAEMTKVILQNQPIRGHFNGCYTVHPECVVKAMTRSAGIIQPPRGYTAMAG